MDRSLKGEITEGHEKLLADWRDYHHATGGKHLLFLREMQWKQLIRWTVPVLSVALATAARAALDPWLGSDIPFAFYFLAVTVSAQISGFLAAVLATALSAFFVTYFFIPPRFSLVVEEPPHILAIIIFVLISLAIARLGYMIQRVVEKLQRSEGRLRATFDNAGVGILEVAQDDKLIGANEEACRILGYSSPKELLGIKIHDLTAPEDRKESAKINRAIHEGRKDRISYEKRYLRRDGAPVWVSVTVCAVRDSEGRWIRSIASVEDISERKRGEEQLRIQAQVLWESENRLRKAQEIARLGSWQLDLTTNGLSWSDEVYRIFGLQPQEFGATYEAFLDRVHPDDRAAVDAAYSGSLRDGKDSYEIEHRVIRKDNGEVRFVHEKCEHTRDERGRIIRSVGMVHDITERKRAEEALKEADRHKDEFLAMLAHELRNPMSTISAASALLVRTSTPGQTTVVEALQRQTKNLAKLVDDLLDVSRVVRGKITLEKETVNLHEAIQQAIDVAKRDIEQGKHKLVTQIPNEPLPVFGDLLRLQQIVSNLLSNAARYSREGGVISVTVWRSGNSVVMKVQDTGLGIPKQYHRIIFEPFRQIDPGFHRPRGGLGIGLTLVKRLTEMHGGTIRVDSEGTGKGSTFTVCLPLIKQLEGAVDRPRAEVRPGLQILIVEDNRDAAVLTAALLEGAGHKTFLAYDGETGLEQALKQAFDVILLDIGLPGLDGYEVARRIRAAGQEEPLIIAVSGYGQEQDKRRSEEAGFDAHLLKPLEFDVLDPILAEWQTSARARALHDVRNQSSPQHWQ